MNLISNHRLLLIFIVVTKAVTLHIFKLIIVTTSITTKMNIYLDFTGDKTGDFDYF